MDTIHMFYLALLAFGCIPLTLYSYILYRESKSKENKYKLFQIRDDLIYLVAVNIIKEDDPVFTEFYKMINIIIRHSDEFTLRSFIQASIDAKNDLEADTSIERLMERIHSSHPEVKKVINNMFKVITEIMVENSVILKIIVKNNIINRQISKLAVYLKRSSMYQKEHNLYSLYTSYDHLRKRLGLQPAL